VGGRARSSPLGRAKVNVGCCARLDWSFLAPVAQGIERSPAEAEARGSNPLGRMRSRAAFAALFASRGKRPGFPHGLRSPGSVALPRLCLRAATGQEEVIFAVAGSGRLRVDGDEVELKPGRFVR